MMHVWRRPIELALLTCFALTAALLGTGIWRWAAWIALAVPVGVVMCCIWRSYR